MESVLEHLGSEPWVRGSLIVSNEGMVVCDALQGGLDRDAVSALAGLLVNEVSAGLQENELEPFARVVLSATAGELVVVDCGQVYLVVITTAGSEAFYIEIDSAARRVRQLAPKVGMKTL